MRRNLANPTLVFSRLSSSVLKWLIDRCLEPLLTGAVARMRDFISDVIQLSSLWRVQGFPSRSRSRDQSFLSSGPIFRLIMASIWLLSMSPGTPTSFKVLYERLTRCTRSQDLETSPSCSVLNLFFKIMLYCFNSKYTQSNTITKLLSRQNNVKL